MQSDIQAAVFDLKRRAGKLSIQSSSVFAPPVFKSKGAAETRCQWYLWRAPFNQKPGWHQSRGWSLSACYTI